MRKNFTFKKKKSHKLLFSIVAILSITVISVLAYTSYAETEQEEYTLSNTNKKLNCEIVFSISEQELKLEFGETDKAPKEYGIIRRCENPEIVCYYISGPSSSLFCQFKRFDTVRVKGSLKPE